MAAVSPMRLRHSPASPFVRKVMVFAHECGLAERIEIVATDTWDPATDLVRDNPLGKVPTLLAADGVFIGSLLICEYFDSLHGGEKLIPPEPERRWPVMRLHALADGAMEAAVASVTECLRRPPEFVHEPYVQRQYGKIRRALMALDGMCPPPSARLDLGQMTLACLLGYLDFRMGGLIAWRERHPGLARFHDAVAQRPAMAATKPRART
jgi:glutathione S-transferase